jgi:hypothetical protein
VCEAQDDDIYGRPHTQKGRTVIPCCDTCTPFFGVECTAINFETLVINKSELWTSFKSPHCFWQGGEKNQNNWKIFCVRVHVARPFSLYAMLDAGGKFFSAVADVARCSCENEQHTSCIWGKKLRRANISASVCKCDDYIAVAAMHIAERSREIGRQEATEAESKLAVIIHHIAMRYMCRGRTL